MPRRVFVGPTLADSVHVVVDSETSCSNMRQWARSYGLHDSNMEDHVFNPRSDQKCNGWRLIERLCWIQHITHTDWILPVLGTVDLFLRSCAHADDGRAKLKSDKSLKALLGN